MRRGVRACGTPSGRKFWDKSPWLLGVSVRSTRGVNRLRGGKRDRLGMGEPGTGFLIILNKPVHQKPDPLTQFQHTSGREGSFTPSHNGWSAQILQGCFCAFFSFKTHGFFKLPFNHVWNFYNYGFFCKSLTFLASFQFLGKNSKSP